MAAHQPHGSLAAPVVGMAVTASDRNKQLEAQNKRLIDTVNELNLTLATITAIVYGDGQKSPVSDGDLVKAVGKTYREIRAAIGQVQRCEISTDQFYATVTALVAGAKA